MTNSPHVLDPSNFDEDAAWKECNKYVENCGGLSHEDGEPNWQAAFGADPGIVSCPMCNEFYWAWGLKQQCKKCNFIYPTNWWPMFSWGAQAGRGQKLFLKSKRHEPSMKHPYYNYGFHNPPEGDLYKAAHEIDWRTVLSREERG